MKINTIDLQYISQLIYETHHLPVTYINSLGKIIFDYSSTNNPSYISLKEQLKTYPYHKDSNAYPIFSLMLSLIFSILMCSKRINI